MTNEDRDRFNELIIWLTNWCFDHEIGVVYSKEADPKAKSKSYNIPGDLVVINGNWLPETEVPFIFAHEIGHTIENTPIFNKLSYLLLSGNTLSVLTGASLSHITSELGYIIVCPKK